MLFKEEKILISFVKLKTRNLVTIKMSFSVSLSFALFAFACYANALYPVIMSKWP